MPVIVIGADTALGEAILEALLAPDREIRAFVSDADAALRLRDRGVKVALGDLSDSSHIGAACTACFSAVLVTSAIEDGRELAFATSPEAVVGGWADAVGAAGVHRSIWVMEGSPPPTATEESAVVEPSQGEAAIAARVAELDDAASLS